jgi:hypothetical protein
MSHRKRQLSIKLHFVAAPAAATLDSSISPSSDGIARQQKGRL